MNNGIFSDRLTSAQVAEILGVKPATMTTWRCVGRYPIRYFKIGRRVFYKRADVDAFIESCRKDHT